MENQRWLVAVCFGAAMLGGLMGGGMVITFMERPLIITSEVIERAPTPYQGAPVEEVKPQGINIAGIIILVAALSLVIVGIVVMTKRLSKD